MSDDNVKKLTTVARDITTLAEMLFEREMPGVHVGAIFIFGTQDSAGNVNFRIAGNMPDEMVKAHLEAALKNFDEADDLTLQSANQGTPDADGGTPHTH